MIRTIAAAAGLAVAASGASAAFVGGGTYTFGATAQDGTALNVHRMFLGFELQGGPDEVLNIFNANFQTTDGSTMFQVADPGDGSDNDLPPGETLIGFDADLAFDSFASINTLRSPNAFGADPNGINFDATGMIGDSGWSVDNPDDNIGEGIAPGGNGLNGNPLVPAGLVPADLFYVFIGQFTTVGGAEGTGAEFLFGNGFIASDVFEGELSLTFGTSLADGTQLIDVFIGIPTPGALALFGVAGLTAVRRRR